jgi:hypothetical protein
MPTLVDGSLGSLVQGMSQQPSRARLPGQSEWQLNVTNNEVFGMSRRQSLEYLSVANRFDADADGDFVTEHGNFRMGDVNARYLLRVAGAGDNPELVLTRKSNRYTVTMDEGAKEYMRTDKDVNPYGRRVLLKEMDDRLFVVNTQKTVTALPDLPDYGNNNSTVVYCRGGKYANGYTIRFKAGDVEHMVTWSTPDGSDSSHTTTAHARYIVKQLHDICTIGTGSGNGTTAAVAFVGIDVTDQTWVAAPGFYYASTGAKAWLQANFAMEMVGAHLVFTPFDPDFEYLITSYEATASELLVDVRDSIKDVGRLPIRAPNGMVVRIEGSNRAEDDYYLQWVVEDATVGDVVDEKGSWQECTAPDQQFKLDPATMPHELVVDETGEKPVYSLQQMEWAERESGNDYSNPFPEFVGREIADVADWMGRAVFLHMSDVNLSRSSEYLNWFKQTATTLLDTDPVNLRSTATKGDSHLIYAIPFNKDLVIFGTNGAQFVISGRETLTNGNASMVLTSEFDADLTTRPQALGDSIMFTSWSGKYTLVHEMYLDGTQNNHARRTVTDHVPRLLPGRARLFASNDGANTAMVVTDNDPRTVYVYEFLWIDSTRVQSAWSIWTFDGDLENVRIDDGLSTMTLQTASGGFMTGTLPMYRKDADGMDFPMHMDYMRRQTLDNETVLHVRSTGNSQELGDIIVLADDTIEGSSIQGMPLAIESLSTKVQADGVPNLTTVTLSQPYTGDVITGTRFKTSFIPTMPVIRDSDGVAITQAELTVQEFAVTCEDTGPFMMTRECTYEAPEDYWSFEYSGRVLGDPDFMLGTVPVDSSVVTFPFDDLTTTSKLVLDCNTHLPMTITEIEWHGTVRNRYRRISNGG